MTKKNKYTKKIVLNKKLISVLNSQALEKIIGGGCSDTCPPTHTCDCSNCPSKTCLAD